MTLIIKQLFIYPIKGIAGIAVNSAQAEEIGFQHDRRMMFVDDQNNFISQRSHPELSQIQCTILDGHYMITYSGKQIKIPFENGQALYDERLKFAVKVFDDELMAYELSPEISLRFSELLGAPVKLVTLGKESLRMKTLIKEPLETKVSFADGYPYLVLGTASLLKLEEMMELSVNKMRFRPNMIIETTFPFEEDVLDLVNIGSAQFRMIKPCARCQVVNIDPETGLSEKQTLATLSAFRKVENKVYFGVNTICLKEGEVKVGDSLDLVNC
ncbi:MAG TPA: MOSC domain-containing protein [Saprospiraceae bacterium]|nr:MOSC domain-containing protein [Saprospiraceae bacterium]HPN70193.1 MOSC domain-containing protein [Saprospiraceae bacterium]